MFRNKPIYQKAFGFLKRLIPIRCGHPRSSPKCADLGRTFSGDFGLSQLIRVSIDFISIPIHQETFGIPRKVNILLTVCQGTMRTSTVISEALRSVEFVFSRYKSYPPSFHEHFVFIRFITNIRTVITGRELLCSYSDLPHRHFSVFVGWRLCD